MSKIIEVKNLSFSYSQRVILKNLSFEVKSGTFLAIAGPNGAGKTTLLNLLCGLLKPDAGSIKINDSNINSYSIKKLAQKVAVVRQEFVPVFDFTVTEMVSMARTPYLGTFIARALAQNTAILLLDEPTTFLDLKHQVGIYDLLKAAQLEKDKTIVAVTHDINLAAQYCDEALLLGGPADYHTGKTKDVFSSRQIEKVFGVSTFAGKVGQEKFFIPLGKFAKDSEQITRKLHDNQ